MIVDQCGTVPLSYQNPNNSNNPLRLPMSSAGKIHQHPNRTLRELEGVNLIRMTMNFVHSVSPRSAAGWYSVCPLPQYGASSVWGPWPPTPDQHGRVGANGQAAAG